jgi:HAD superfamily, subfamily IIIB (Acid phosphatase)
MGSAVAYKSGVRHRLTEQGYWIIVNIGDWWSDLDGGYAEATIKLPNPMYYIWADGLEEIDPP